MKHIYDPSDYLIYKFVTKKSRVGSRSDGIVTEDSGNWPRTFKKLMETIQETFRKLTQGAQATSLRSVTWSFH